MAGLALIVLLVIFPVLLLGIAVWALHEHWRDVLFVGGLYGLVLLIGFLN